MVQIGSHNASLRDLCWCSSSRCSLRDTALLPLPLMGVGSHSGSGLPRTKTTKHPKSLPAPYQPTTGGGFKARLAVIGTILCVYPGQRPRERYGGPELDPLGISYSSHVLFMQCWRIGSPFLEWFALQSTRGPTIVLARAPQAASIGLLTQPQ